MSSLAPTSGSDDSVKRTASSHVTTGSEPPHRRQRTSDHPHNRFASAIENNAQSEQAPAAATSAAASAAEISPPPAPAAGLADVLQPYSREAIESLFLTLYQNIINDGKEPNGEYASLERISTKLLGYHFLRVTTECDDLVFYPYGRQMNANCFRRIGQPSKKLPVNNATPSRLSGVIITSRQHPTVGIVVDLGNISETAVVSNNVCFPVTNTKEKMAFQYIDASQASEVQTDGYTCPTPFSSMPLTEVSTEARDYMVKTIQDMIACALIPSREAIAKFNHLATEEELRAAIFDMAARSSSLVAASSGAWWRNASASSSGTSSNAANSANQGQAPAYASALFRPIPTTEFGAVAPPPYPSHTPASAPPPPYPPTPAGGRSDQ